MAVAETMRQGDRRAMLEIAQLYLKLANQLDGREHSLLRSVPILERASAQTHYDKGTLPT